MASTSIVHTALVLVRGTYHTAEEIQVTARKSGIMMPKVQNSQDTRSGHTTLSSHG